MTNTKSCIISLALAILFLSGRDSGKKAERPNIIVFLADDMGWGDSGCYGSDKILSPKGGGQLAY